MMKDENTRNIILAAALSLIVLVGWQYLVVNPRVEQQRQREAAIEAQRQVAQPAQPSTPGAPSVPATGNVNVAPATVAPSLMTREAAIAASPRVAIDTPRLRGSISLRGGRIDDLSLKQYRETVNPSSPNIVLFNPANTQDAFFAEMGVVGASGSTMPMPGADTLWKVEGSEALTPSHPVTLTYDNGKGLTFRRTYAIDADYMFTVKDEVTNSSGEAVQLYPYARIFRYGTPRTAGYYILHEGAIGVLGSAGLKEITYADLKKSLSVTEKASTGWLGITDKYWAATVIPDQTSEFQGSFTANVSGPVETYESGYYLLNVQSVAPQATTSVTHRLFAGAKEVAVVDGYASKFTIDRFDRLIDWGWFYFFTKPLFWAIDFFFKLIGNFGFAILIVTVIVKLVFFPLANKSYESMSRMKKIQPEMTAIRERFADDKMKQQQAMMELYKKEKINPLAGCLPVLIQIPVFFSLYKVLFVSIEMRHSPFIGWIHDLSSPDPTNVFNLFGLIPFDTPAFLHLGAWPLIMGVTMFLQMKMNPDPPDPVQKQVFTWMPLLFTFMLASMPAGLVIYWTWNNILSVAQQYFIMRRNGVKVELWDNLRGLLGKPAPKS